MSEQSAAYMRRWRDTPVGREVTRCHILRRRARDWARQELAARHPEEFERLYRRALADAGDLPVVEKEQS